MARLDERSGKNVSAGRGGNRSGNSVSLILPSRLTDGAPRLGSRGDTDDARLCGIGLGDHNPTITPAPLGSTRAPQHPIRWPVAWPTRRFVAPSLPQLLPVEPR